MGKGKGPVRPATLLPRWREKAALPYRRSHGNNGGYIRSPSLSDEVNPNLPNLDPVLSSGGAREVCAHPVSAWKQTPKTTSLTPRTGSQKGICKGQAGSRIFPGCQRAQLALDGAVPFLVSGTGTVVCQVATHQH